MKFIIILFLFGSMRLATGSNCSLAVTYAEMAYADYKKAYESDSLDEAKVHLKKAITEAAESSAYAATMECKCTLAESYALNAVTFGKKAEKSEDLKSLRKFAKKAMNMSLDVLTAVPNCK